MMEVPAESIRESNSWAVKGKKDKVSIEKPNILVVEGKEDQMVFDALIKYMNLQNIQVIPSEGKDNIRKNLMAVMSAPGEEIKSIAIVRDGDARPKSAFQSVCDALRNAGLPVPESPGKFAIGNVAKGKLEGRELRVAVLILPDPDTPGMLEDLCLKAVEESDQAMPCVAEYFECLSRNKLPFPQNVAKAKVQVFLASRHEAGLRLGEAAQKGYIPWDAEAFSCVRDFLKRMSGGCV